MTDTLQVTLQVDALDTPALLVDLDALEHNARHMAARCADAGLAWRPHVKACKTPELARIVVDCGAVGITCAKVSEAEAMVAGGLDDVLIANEVVGQEKVGRLVEPGARSDDLRGGRRRSESEDDRGASGRSRRDRRRPG